MNYPSTIKVRSVDSGSQLPELLDYPSYVAKSPGSASRRVDRQSLANSVFEWIQARNIVFHMQIYASIRIGARMRC